MPNTGTFTWQKAPGVQCTLDYATNIVTCTDGSGYQAQPVQGVPGQNMPTNGGPFGLPSGGTNPAGGYNQLPTSTNNPLGTSGGGNMADNDRPWYQDPSTWAMILGGAGSLYGAYNQNQTNNQNYDLARQQMGLQAARQQQVTNYVNQFLQPGQNPYSGLLMQMLGFGGGGGAGSFQTSPFNWSPQYNGLFAPQPSSPLTGPGYMTGTGWTPANTGSWEQLKTGGFTEVGPGATSGVQTLPGGMMGIMADGSQPVSGGAVDPRTNPANYTVWQRGAEGPMTQVTDPSTLAGFSMTTDQYGVPRYMPGHEQDVQGNLLSGVSPYSVQYNVPTPGQAFTRYNPQGDRWENIAPDTTEFQQLLAASGQAPSAITPRPIAGGEAGIMPPAPAYMGPGSPFNQPVGPTQVSGASPFTGGPGGFQRPAPITAGQYNPYLIDLAGFSGTSNLNQGQDALSQLLNESPTWQTEQGVGTNLLDMMNTGAAYDTSNLFNALDTRAQNDLDRQMADLQGGARSYGARLGTAMTNTLGQARGDALANLNLQRQQIGMQAHEAAQGRRMGALGIGTQREGAQNQFNLGTYGARGDLARALASSRLQAGDLLGRMQLANQAAANQGAQFNIGTGMQTQTANAGLNQDWNNFMMQVIGQSNAMQQAQQGQNAGLIGILGGLPQGQVPVAQASAYPGAFQNIAQLMMLRNYL